MLTTLCILLLSLISSYSVQCQSPHSSGYQVTATEIPTVSLCTLLSKPADYNGKEIRVHAKYHIGFEHSYLDDSSCKEYAVETTPYWTGNVVWAEFDRLSVETLTEQNVYKEFQSNVANCCSLERRDAKMELVVVGRFSKASDKVGYGHFKRFALQLVINKIEKASKTESIDSSPQDDN